MKVWILTSEYNDYDQHGEYFEAIYGSKPTAEQLMKDHDMSADDAAHVLSGGGRRNHEHQWFWLREQVPTKVPSGVALPHEGSIPADHKSAPMAKREKPKPAPGVGGNDGR